MVYFTVRNTTGGYHGHQLKDLLGGITLGKVFDFKYVHDYYHYLEFFALGYGEPKVENLPEDIDYIRMGGPFWNGINHENATKAFSPIKDTYKNKDCLLTLENALRIHPFQTIDWCDKKLINKNVFEEVASEVTARFESKHKNREAYYDKNKFNIAIHINRGQDFDEGKFPEHFSDPTNVRYMFPVSYYEKIIDSISEVLNSKPHQFHIYTEKLGAEKIVETFKTKTNVVLHLGDNRDKGNIRLIHEIFFHFIKSDLLVTCNSSFSTVASYFRNNKLTIYHPHAHLANLPEGNFLATNDKGEFDTGRLQKFVS